jgi:hypothetical protein
MLTTAKRKATQRRSKAPPPPAAAGKLTAASVSSNWKQLQAKARGTATATTTTTSSAAPPAKAPQVEILVDSPQRAERILQQVLARRAGQPPRADWITDAEDDGERVSRRKRSKPAAVDASRLQTS